HIVPGRRRTAIFTARSDAPRGYSPMQGRGGTLVPVLKPGGRARSTRRRPWRRRPSMADIPLAPAQGGRSIPTSVLEPADVIVSTTAAWTSRMIRKATQSVVSHSVLYMGGDEVVEADRYGVIKQSVTESLKDATLAVAYRRKDITDVAVQVILS